MSKQLLSELENSPDAVLVIEAFQKMLKAEQKKREAFHDLVHDEMKAEFINGEVVIQSPVKRRHWKVTTRLGRYLDEFVEKNGLGEVGVEKVMISLSRNDYEPDVCFFSQEKAKNFTEDQSLFPPPDFIVEVTSPKTENRDRGVKFTDYAAHGVAEYWIIDPDKKTIEQYLLNAERQGYDLHTKLLGNGEIEACAVPGFKLQLSQLFS